MTKIVLAYELLELGISQTRKKNITGQDNPKKIPSVEEVVRELGTAKSIDDFYGKEGIFAGFFLRTSSKCWKLSYHGHYTSSMRTSGGDTKVKVPRDRNDEFPHDT